MVDASLAAILQEIAQSLARDRQRQRAEMAAILEELRLLRAELKRGHRLNGHAAEEPEVEALIS